MRTPKIAIYGLPTLVLISVFCDVKTSMALEPVFTGESSVSAVSSGELYLPSDDPIGTPLTSIIRFRNIKCTDQYGFSQPPAPELPSWVATRGLSNEIN